MTISEIRAIYKKIYDIGRSYERSYHFSKDIVQNINQTIIQSVDETVKVDEHYNDQFTIDIYYYESYYSGNDDTAGSDKIELSIMCTDSGITLDYNFYSGDEQLECAHCEYADISEFKDKISLVNPNIFWYNSNTGKVIEEIQQYVNSLDI